MNYKNVETAQKECYTDVNSVAASPACETYKRNEYYVVLENVEFTYDKNANL